MDMKGETGAGIRPVVATERTFEMVPRGQSTRYIAWRTFRKHPAGMAGLIGLLLLILVALLAPVLSPYDPVEMDFERLLAPPDADHWFGTDDVGRDILSRTIWGGRETLRVALLSIIIALTGGVVVGLVSGFYGGVVDNVIQRLVEITMAFPTILLLLSIVAALGPGLRTILVAIGMSSIPAYARLVRGSVLSARCCEYVTAAQVIGANNRRIMFRHILPNIVAPVIIYGTVGLGSAVLMTAGLSYIGLCAKPPSPEWGAMLNYGRTYMREAWWMSVFPGVAIFLAVLTVNLLGDGLRDALDPRLRH